MFHINFNRREKKPVKYDAVNYGLSIFGIVACGGFAVLSAYGHLIWGLIINMLCVAINAGRALQQQEAKRAEEAAKTEDET